MKKFNNSFILIFISLSILLSGCGDEEKPSTENNRGSYTFSNNSNNSSYSDKKERTDELDASSDISLAVEAAAEEDSDVSDNDDDVIINSLEILAEDAMKSMYNCINDYLFLMQNAQYINMDVDFIDEMMECIELFDQLEKDDASSLQETINKTKEINKKITTILSNNGLKAAKVIEYDDFVNLIENSDFDDVPDFDDEVIEQLVALIQLLEEYVNYGYLDQQSINEFTSIANEMMISYQKITSNPLSLFDSSVMSKMVSDYNKWLQQLKNICYRNNIDFSSIM